MFLGRVVGTVWSTVKWPELRGLKLLLVKPYHLSDLELLAAQAGQGQALRDAPTLPDTSDTVVCADLLDAGVGDDVIVAYGHAARVAAWEATLQREGAPGSIDSSGLADPAQAPPIPIDAAVVAVVDSLHVDT